MLILFVFVVCLGCFLRVIFVHVMHQMYLIYTACNRLRLSTDIKSLITYLLTYLLTVTTSRHSGVPSHGCCNSSNTM